LQSRAGQFTEILGCQLRRLRGEKFVRITREFYTVAELEEYLAYVKSESMKQLLAAGNFEFIFAAYDNK
jgi:hypothetical protein